MEYQNKNQRYIIPSNRSAGGKDIKVELIRSKATPQTPIARLLLNGEQISNWEKGTIEDHSRWLHEFLKKWSAADFSDQFIKDWMEGKIK